MVCTFFGHRDAPEEAKRSLEIVVENLINQKGVDLFYVGNQGKFWYKCGRSIPTFAVLKCWLIFR